MKIDKSSYYIAKKKAKNELNSMSNISSKLQTSFNKAFDVGKLYLYWNVTKRIRDSIMVFIIGLLFIVTDFSAVKLVIVLVLTFVVFRSDYNRVKNYYKVHLHDINLKLPYYVPFCNHSFQISQ